MKNINKKTIAKFIAFSGPALIVSIGYMDPGNYGTDIAGGASFGYGLLWVVWLSSIMAMLIQYLSGKIGIATEHSLPEVIRDKLQKKMFVIPYWLSAEIVAAATDLAEYLGTVVALNLLFGVPLIYASIFVAVGIIGATVMPHLVFLHSSLTKDRAQGKSLEERRKMRKHHLAETVIL